VSDLHVYDFYQDTGRIFILLWSAFPRKTALYVEDICSDAQTDEFGLHSKRYLSCFATMLWLGDEGYLRFDGVIRQEAVDQAVLTHKSFVILSAPSDVVVSTDDELACLPASVRSEHLSNINQLRVALARRSSEAIAIVVRSLLACKHGGVARAV